MAKILVAEDERDIRELIVFSLTHVGGYEVVEVTNGLEAVEQAIKEMPDLIIMDVRMPKMTGYEACKELKNRAETAGIPVIFLSAKGQEPEIKQGLALGAEEYILKPFAPDELFRRVSSVLGRRQE
jgi:two-component system alkaline phosphatase synthesis response regulator PhoP